MDAELLEQIENLIDTDTAGTIIEAVSEVCRLKAAHIRENWQDVGLAQEWDFVADELDRIDAHV